MRRPSKANEGPRSHRGRRRHRKGTPCGSASSETSSSRASATFDLPATFLTLAVPSETTKQMAARWEAEVLPRLAEGEPHGLVIGVGPGDVTAGISTARSRLNLANITDRATALGIPSFVVGPPPLAGVDSGSLKALSSSCSEVCARRGIPFVDCYTPLVAHDQWFEARMARPCPDRPATPSWRGSSSTRAGTSGREQPRRTCERLGASGTPSPRFTPPQHVRAHE